jgi:hypothetical protein
MSTKIESLKSKMQTKRAETNKKNAEIQAARSALNQKKAEIERLKIRLGQLPANAKAEEYHLQKQLGTLQSEADALEFENILRMEAERDTLQTEVKTLQAEYDSAKVSEVMKDMCPLIDQYNRVASELAGLIESIYGLFYSMPTRVRNCAPGAHRENIHKLPTLNLINDLRSCPTKPEQEPEALFSLRQFAKRLTGIDDAANWGPELHFYEPRNW